MRRTMLGRARDAFLVVALAVGVAACGAGGGIGLPPIGGGGSTVEPSKVQSLTTKLCGFVPTASSILALAGTFFNLGSGVDLVERIATTVCNELKNRPLAEGPLIINGVRVEGRYVARRR